MNLTSAFGTRLPQSSWLFWVWWCIGRATNPPSLRLRRRQVRRRLALRRLRQRRQSRNAGWSPPPALFPDVGRRTKTGGKAACGARPASRTSHRRAIDVGSDERRRLPFLANVLFFPANRAGGSTQDLRLFVRGGPL